MHIERNIDMHKWVGDTLEELRLQLPPIIENKCYHCGLVMRFPLVARQSDVDMFKTLIESAYKVMDKHEITANLLADIRAQCHIEISKRPKV